MSVHHVRLGCPILIGVPTIQEKLNFVNVMARAGTGASLLAHRGNHVASVMVAWFALIYKQTQTTAAPVVMHVVLMHIVQGEHVTVMKAMETVMVIGLMAVKSTQTQTETIAVHVVMHALQITRAVLTMILQTVLIVVQVVIVL